MGMLLASSAQRVAPVPPVDTFQHYCHHYDYRYEILLYHVENHLPLAIHFHILLLQLHLRDLFVEELQ